MQQQQQHRLIRVEKFSDLNSDNFARLGGWDTWARMSSDVKVSRDDMFAAGAYVVMGDSVITKVGLEAPIDTVNVFLFWVDSLAPEHYDFGFYQALLWEIEGKTYIDYQHFLEARVTTTVPLPTEYYVEVVPFDFDIGERYATLCGYTSLDEMQAETGIEFDKLVDVCAWVPLDDGIRFPQRTRPITREMLAGPYFKGDVYLWTFVGNRLLGGFERVYIYRYGGKWWADGDALYG